MYGTGQYDYQILQVLERIESIITRVDTVLSGLADNWIPLLFCGILAVGVICLLHWLVKI